MFRSRSQLSLITLALLAPVASARAIIPQQTGSGSGGRVSVRTRCATCGTARDSLLRQRLERLSLKSDSLRWQIDNVRLSPAERDRVGMELNNTLLQIKATLDEQMNATVVVSGSGPATATTRVAPGVVVRSGGRGQPGAAAMAYESWKPRGYLGVTFDGPVGRELRDGEHYIRYYQYPKAALIESNSPAERAGILVGDTLLELNGTDVREEISLTRLLVPDRRITVRVRRDGDNKDLPVVVRESPEYYELRSVPLARTPRPSQPPSRVDVWQSPPAQPAPTPVAPRLGTVWIMTQGVAGARLQTINAGLGKALGVREGVLVLDVTPGPAYNAGLREGDVIQRAGGRTVPHVRALQEILHGADGEEGVKLVIRREGKQREMMLHW